LPSSQESVEELSAETAIDVDTRALEGKSAPNVIFGRPHAGEYVPIELRKRMTKGGKKLTALVDRGTHEIFKSENIPSVATKIQRFIVDPNRAVSGESDESGAPGELLWKQPSIDEDDMLDMEGAIYKKGEDPTEEEIAALRNEFYLPYYNSMMGMIGSVADRRESSEERMLIVDGHSFPVSKNLEEYWNIPKYEEVEDPRKLPLFIIGNLSDEGNIGADKDIVEKFRKALENAFRNLSEEKQQFLHHKLNTEDVVAVNKALTGVHNIDFYGDAGERPEGINAIQVEINEAPLADEADDNWFDFDYNEDGMELMQQLIEEAAMEVNEYLQNNQS
jgi:N-formylglutamate amidohydrolase